MTNLTNLKEEAERGDSEEPEPVLDPEREKERVDDEAAEELLLLVKKTDAVSTEEPAQSEKEVGSERMEAQARENDKAGMRRNSQGKGKNRGGNKGKRRKEKM